MFSRCVVVVVALYLHHHIRPTERRHTMSITIKAHGKATGTAAMVERLNDLLEHIGHARKRNDVKNFEYYSGVYDGYREALAAMGYSVVYSATLNIVGIETR